MTLNTSGMKREGVSDAFRGSTVLCVRLLTFLSRIEPRGSRTIEAFRQESSVCLFYAGVMAATATATAGGSRRTAVGGVVPRDCRRTVAGRLIGWLPV
ncbi:hypothetical protein E2C01_086705 [Portunus trituberculatus]|uniref:Uncharacterized protein n=1 Tax=Portunus trituberculatus TaxID=210409 RepID=A0A5B7JB98_PORTR|nr:hypothetical protein [Portunus trituberculatus]